MNILQVNSSARADGSHSSRLAGAMVERLLDIEVSAYLLATNWDHFLELQERLLSDIIAIVSRSGASMAMPSQTMYVDGGPERVPPWSLPNR